MNFNLPRPAKGLLNRTSEGRVYESSHRESFGIFTTIFFGLLIFIFLLAPGLYLTFYSLTSGWWIILNLPLGVGFLFATFYAGKAVFTKYKYG